MSRLTCLYFITDQRRTAVKIGLSDRSDRRLRDLQAGSPVVLRLEHVEEDCDASLECAIHQHFGKHWRHREWFTYAPELRAFVERLKSGDLDAFADIPAAPFPKGYRDEQGWLLTYEDTLRFIRDGVMPRP